MGGTKSDAGIPFLVIGAKGDDIGTPIDFVSVHKRVCIKSPAVIPRNPAAAPRKIYTNLKRRAERPR